MATANDVLDAARAEIGYNRYNDPETGTKYGRWYASLVGNSYYGANGVPYCAMFVSWVMNKVGASCAGVPGAYCPTMLNAAKNVGAVIGNKQSCVAGDVAYFNWDGGVVDHVGFIEKNMGSYAQTIEGNTSSSSNANGGQVARRTRAWSCIEAVVRPSYNGKPSSVSTPSANVSSATSGKIDEDGQWGPATTTRLQQYLGTPVDGIVSDQSIAYKSQNPGLFSNSWQWKSHPKTGSTMVKALQRKVGSAADGFIGPNTIKALQAKLGTTQDGVCSNPSDVVRALQKALNNNTF